LRSSTYIGKRKHAHSRTFPLAPNDANLRKRPRRSDRKKRLCSKLYDYYTGGEIAVEPQQRDTRVNKDFLVISATPPRAKHQKGEHKAVPSPCHALHIHTEFRESVDSELKNSSLDTIHKHGTFSRSPRKLSSLQKKIKECQLLIDEIRTNMEHPVFRGQHIKQKAEAEQKPQKYARKNKISEASKKALASDISLLNANHAAHILNIINRNGKTNIAHDVVNGQILHISLDELNASVFKAIQTYVQRVKRMLRKRGTIQKVGASGNHSAQCTAKMITKNILNHEPCDMANEDESESSSEESFSADESETDEEEVLYF